MRIGICCTQVPFSYGGAEILVETLERELVRRGFEAERISLPFNWFSRDALIKSALLWRLLDLKSGAGDDFDLVIATRFPSYLIRHANKVVWLVHQFRQAYDLDGTRFGSLGKGAEDRSVVEAVRSMDARGLGEARALFAIARNVASRLERYNGLAARTLYPPPKLADRLRCDDYGDFIFFAGRLDELKRIEPMIQAFRHTRSDVRGVVAGSGPLRERLSGLVAELGLEQRIELVGWIDDEQLVERYASCLGVYHAPYDEDYGFVTLEAHLSSKPVVTAADAGGVLEFVRDGRTGFVCERLSPQLLARAFDRLFEERERARALGEAGRKAATAIGWDHVIDSLTATLPA